MFKSARTSINDPFSIAFWAAVSLFIALFIYLVFRNENTLVCIITKNLLSASTFQQLKQRAISFISIHEVLIFSLPGALWMFSACLISRNLHIKLSYIEIRLDILPLFAIFYFELMQKTGLLKGYFDWNDLWIPTAFFIFYTSLFRPKTTESIKNNISLSASSLLSIYSMVYLAHLC